MSDFTYSSHGTPCPICGREKDGDCRIQPGFVLCHTHQENSDRPGWKYLGLTDIWGQWLKTSKETRLDGPTRLKKVFAYPTRDGKPLVHVERVDSRQGKRFSQYHWSGSNFEAGLPKENRAQIAIYRYSAVRDAIANGEMVFWVEGETCADALWKIGIAATTSIGGSSGFARYGNYSQDLEGATVVMAPDRDKQGMKYAVEVADFFGITQWCKFGPKAAWNEENLPDKGGLDLLDWIEQGATVENILAAIEGDREEKNLDDGYDELMAELEGVLELEGPRKNFALNNLAKKHRLSPFDLLTWHEDERSLNDPDNQMQPFSDVLANRIEELSEMDGVPGNRLPTGYDRLDPLLGGGLRPGSVLTIAGATGSGKSAWCLSSLALNHHNRRRPKTLFISGEMSEMDLLDRLIASYADINFGNLETGLSDRDWNEIYEMYDRIKDMNLQIFPKITDIDGIRREAIAAQKQMDGLDLIFIDYIQLMRSSNRRSRVEELAEITRGTKQLAMELEIPIVMAAQVNRSVDSRPDKRPRLSDLRESGTIEQDSDIVVFIYRDEYYDPNTTDKGIAELILAKNRHGKTGTTRCLFYNGMFHNISN